MTYKKKYIMVTGGLGYIGSNLVVQLGRKGYDVIIVDNLSNSKPSIVNKIQEHCVNEVIVKNCDINNQIGLEEIFSENNIVGVFHLAGLKSVTESFALPIEYINTNVHASQTLLETMARFEVNKLIFSSSATVYGDTNIVPITENHPTAPKSVYGQTKLLAEKILTSQAKHIGVTVACLRYFNPGGADASLTFGDDPLNAPTNLIPIFSNKIIDRTNKLEIFGSNYDTLDGTPVRDFVHITDLVNAHVKVFEFIKENSQSCTFNVGTGTGVSVLDIANEYRKITNEELNVKFMPKRLGDIAISVTCIDKIKSETGWVPEYGIKEIISSDLEFRRKESKSF